MARTSRVKTSMCRSSFHRGDTGKHRLWIDAIAVYAPDTDTCYLIPIQEVEGTAMISLRVAPTANNQAQHVRRARDCEPDASLSCNWGVTRPHAVETQRGGR